MSAPRSGIAGQLGLALSAVLAVVIAGSSLFALRSLAQSTELAHRQHLASEAQLLAGQLGSFHQSLKTTTQRLATLFERRFASGLTLGPATDGTTPSLYLDGERLNGDFTLVDEFTTLTGGAATVFARTGDDFVRVTTSVKKEDGSRAIGTLLDRKHPGYAPLLNGQPYVGRATLFGRQYMNQYTPVRDSGGRVIAVLYVGFDYTDEQRNQFQALSVFRIGESGSLGVRDDIAGWLVKPAGAIAVDELDAQLASADPSKLLTWTDGNEDFLSLVAPVAGESLQVAATLPQQEIDALIWRVGTQLALGSLLALFLAVAATIGLLRHRLRPLALLVEQARAFGEGNLKVRVAVMRQDEIGTLSTTFNQMAESLSGTVSKVRSSSSDVTQRADQLNRLATGTEQRSAEQATQLDTMVSAVEQFSATAGEIANGMQRTEQLTAENVTLTKQGAESMRSAANALQQIAGSLSATGQVINGLGERSQQIGGIVGVISSIAEQTNLLALNAAIEAARAGEQGRGFAVVADEVRSLAARTSQATREITDVIASVQEETNRAMASIDEGNRLMKDGLTLNGTVASTLEEIQAHTAQTLDQFADITRATSEQSASASVLSQNLHVVAQDNQSRRKAGAELATTAQQLKSLADALEREVNHFS
ncbi:methyl-accepting chemotaxis protein [Stutzerimonas zhaodongensis]|uniref:Methyl-accepting chemotaxis protein n=1 Tax=Stutzerimonas zhaodongensis TaxID=1176257 RepID=A0A3M2HXR0_9GAMM|nr:methyl-accepting chemotaxis protein [Stutzerimonas zhaodongensis]MCQ4316862.1 methyl-accepting chemotaxis protein [Stutzerimonas zhaodongensis]RMH92603.1 methyl-accepting chemotaxis protein [Stutzerimonas zhaodongensis]